MTPQMAKDGKRAEALHRITGWLLILLLPWKSLVIFRSLKRGTRGHASRGVANLVALVGETLFYDLRRCARLKTGGNVERLVGLWARETFEKV
jgi:hypothetical protein